MGDGVMGMSAAHNGTSGAVESPWLARVYVTLKPTVNDPQGLAIRGGLHHLGLESVESVRAGKYLELRLNELDEGRARERVDAMCR